MKKENVVCLFCQTSQEAEPKQGETLKCCNCGMPLSKGNPEGTRARKKRWLPFFWFIVVFCLVMVFYLPR